MGVRSTVARKFTPFSVNDSDPVSGALDRPIKETTGASKLNAVGIVLTSAPTVAVTASELPAPGAGEHSTDVALVHPVVVQRMPPTATVGVGSTADPKSMPDMVTTAPSDAGALGCAALDSTGASNVKARKCVPTRRGTVTTEVERTPASTIGAAHCTAVAVVQLVVAHTSPGPTEIVALNSVTGPKFRPVSETVMPPVGDTLARTVPETTGASHVNEP